MQDQGSIELQETPGFGVFFNGFFQLTWKKKNL